MITHRLLSADTSTDLSGRYVIFLKERVPNYLGTMISRVLLVQKMVMSRSGKVASFEGLEGFRALGIWFEDDKKFHISDRKVDQIPGRPVDTVVLSVRVAEQKVLICDTIEEVVAMRNREYKRDEAQKLTAKKIEQEMGFAFIPLGSEISLS